MDETAGLFLSFVCHFIPVAGSPVETLPTFPGWMVPLLECG